MKDDLPIVTVIASCYNHERFVVECLDDIRNQTYSNIQLIITDDCSTDHSVEIIENWIKTYDIKCLFIKHTENKGFPKTLNEALTYAEGKYVSIISTDDAWLSEFIEDRVKNLDSFDISIGVVYGNSFLMDENGNNIPEMYIKEEVKPQGNIYGDLAKRNFIPANSVLFRRKCFEEVGQYDENLSFEDYDMWLRISLKCKFIFSQQTLSKYRILDTSLFRSANFKIKSSLVLIYLKQLCFDTPYKKQFENHLIHNCLVLYQMNHKKAPVYLWKNFWSKKKPGNFFVWFLCEIGISYEKAMALFKNFHKSSASQK